jgi:hypothetical protein
MLASASAMRFISLSGTQPLVVALLSLAGIGAKT